MLLKHMHTKFLIERTKIKGGCQSGRKVVTHNSKSDLPLSTWIIMIVFLLILCVAGKLIGGVCALSGTFILTLPIPIVVNSFAGYYKNRLWRNEVAQKKRERAMAQATEAREMQKLYLVQAMAGPMAREGMNLQKAAANQALRAGNGRK